MISVSLKIGAVLVPLLCCLSLDLLAQEAPAETGCEADEIDMGDYCMKGSSTSAKLRPGAKRATPFRVKSMMPGHATEEAQPLPAPAQVAPEAGQPVDPVVDANGYGVQLGVFSSLERASRVAREVAQAVGGPVVLTRIEQDQRILWACIHGPFPDEPAATKALKRLRAGTDFKDAFIKPLDEIELLNPDYASTEK